MIHIESIGKRYQLGVVHHNTLWEAASHRLKGLFSNTDSTPKHDDADHFWALKDVSFDVGEGEVVGIIGRNGAGKSTLLKILSRITPPTEGCIRLKGRVASLLEVGTGFHPELTGRENIFMNGAILGMNRKEIRAKFDEIAAFSEVERFLDTPVKHYSSGMYVRLAFAVAAHLEPEILVIDEVLAVGDLSFQRKCLGKMGEVARAGRTVLFVSHNLGVINRLCTRAVLLDGGSLLRDGVTDEITSTYMSLDKENGTSSVDFSLDPNKPDAQILSVRLLDGKGTPAPGVNLGNEYHIEVTYQIKKPVPDHRVALTVSSKGGDILFVSASSNPRENANPALPGRYFARMYLPNKLLNPGSYVVGAGIDRPGIRVFDKVDYAIWLQVRGLDLPPMMEKSGFLNSELFCWESGVLSDEK